jgi:predicted nuclease with TOPRIM domain
MTRNAKKMQTEMKPVLETAFERMGMKKRTEELWDILDEMEFEKELELSEAEAEQGKVRPLEDALKDIRRKVLNEITC